MVNHLFITVWGLLYSRHFCVLLFIISQERYHTAASAQTFVPFSVDPQEHERARAMKFGLLIDDAPS